MDDDSLLNEPAMKVLNVLRKAARQSEITVHDHNESPYSLVLLDRVKPFLQSLRSDQTVKKMLSVARRGDSMLNILNVLSLALKGKEGIEATTLTEPDDIHVERLTMAELLGLSSSGSETVVHTNTDQYFSRHRPVKHTHEKGKEFEASIRGIAEDAAFFLRKILAHCLDFEKHIKPTLDPLYDLESNALMGQISRTITSYARFGGAAHAILEAHQQAAQKFGENIEQILSKIESPLSFRNLNNLHQMSYELRQHVPFLSMPQDIFAEYGEELRRKHEHLRLVYSNVYGLLCELAFTVKCSSGETIRPPRESNTLLDILGSDHDMAKEMEYSPNVEKISKWAERLSTMCGHPLLENMETISEVVSVLQEMSDMFPSFQRSYSDLLDTLQTKLKDRINEEFPKMAKQHASTLATGSIRIDEAVLNIVAHLLHSPSKKCQDDGIDALALYLEPFAMDHFKKHEQLKDDKEEEYKQKQESRLGKAFRSTMPPYYKPKLEPVNQPSEVKHEAGLSLSHVGPLPTYKGLFVQRHIDRGPVHGGAFTGVFPLVIMIGPSGVGKTDLLEQMSKHEFRPDGTLEDNKTRLVIPLQFSANDIEAIQGFGIGVRQTIENFTKRRVLSLITTILALMRSHRNEHRVPPMPHHLFRYLNNGGSEMINAVASSKALRSVTRLSVVNRARHLLLKESRYHTLCFAVDEVNLLAEQFRGRVQKSSDHGPPTGNMLTAVAHTLQHIGTAVYTGTGLRLKDIEQAISAYGKDIIVAGPAFPPTSFRIAAYVLQNLIGFKALRRGEGANVMQCLELYMLMGRMRIVESFMRVLVEPRTLSGLQDGEVLSETDHLETVFNSAMKLVANGMEQFVKESALLKIQDQDTMKHAISLALCGVMCVPGKPGDPKDYDSVLVRCGLVQLGDRSAHRSSRRHETNLPSDSADQDHYYFVNREPMMQYAMAQALLDPIFLGDKSVLDTEEYIWQDLIEPGNDAHQNGLELLTWLLLRAMSQDRQLHGLIIGPDAELGEYVNETNFVWCDYPTTSPKDRKEMASSYDWLEKLEKETKVSYEDNVQQSYDGLSVSDVHVDDMWFHVTRLQHSDPDKVHFAWRAAVMPPQHLGPDIVGCWRHRTETARVPLLVLAACSTLPRTKRTVDVFSGQRSFKILGEQKLEKDSANTLPSNMGQRKAEEHEIDYSSACKTLHGRQALRILVHPNLDLDGQDNTYTSDLAAMYNLPEEVVKTGRGRDGEDNFVLLLNSTTIHRAIEQRLTLGSSSSINAFPAMVLRLWTRFLYYLDQLHQSKQSKESSI